MSRESAWHLGHILGGYQNPKCPSCQGEEKRRLAYEAKRLGRDTTKSVKS